MTFLFPLPSGQQMTRDMMAQDELMRYLLQTPVAEKERDVKDLYAKASWGKL